MEISEEKSGDIIIITVKGNLDASTHEHLENRVGSLLKSGAIYLLFDMRNLEYISSAGLRVFAKSLKTADSKGGKIVLSSMSDQVKKVFDLSGFAPFFSITGTQEEGLAQFD